MSRRPGAGATDRHALLAGGGYPSSSSRSSPNHLASRGTTASSSSPYEQPYSVYSTTSSTAYRGASFSAAPPPPAGGPPLPPAGHDDAYGSRYSEYDKKAAAAPNGGVGLPGSFAVGMPGAMGAAGGLVGRVAASYGAQRTAQDLEEQNDDRLEGLSAKVRVLKDITLGIGNEVRESTVELGTLSEAFSNSSALLSNTFGRMNRMARRQGGWWCNMMLFLVFVCFLFVLLWLWRR